MLNLCVGEIAQIRNKISTVVDYIKEQNSLCTAETFFNVEIILCELISNVITHSDCSAYLTIEVSETAIVIRVLGKKEFSVDEIILPENDDEHGRGLFLVKEIASELDFLENGKVVQATILI